MGKTAGGLRNNKFNCSQVNSDLKREQAHPVLLPDSPRKPQENWKYTSKAMNYDHLISPFNYPFSHLVITLRANLSPKIYIHIYLFMTYI